MGVIKKTLVMGGLMGAGLIWLTSTKKGKEVRDQLLDQSAEIYLSLKKKAVKLDKRYNITKSQYIKIAKESMDEYFKKHPIPAAMKGIIQNVVISQWETFKEEAQDKIDDTRRAAKTVIKKTAKRARKIRS